MAPPVTELVTVTLPLSLRCLLSGAQEMAQQQQQPQNQPKTPELFVDQEPTAAGGAGVDPQE